MKKEFCIVMVLLLAGCLGSFAQQLYPTTLSSGGSSNTNGSLMLESSVGGLVVETISTPTFMYTQGFLQPDAGSTNTVPYINDVTLSSGSGLDNAGTTFISGNTMLEFTVGEFASITLNSANNMLTQGILQPFATDGTLPVTGLEFYAKRLNNSTVQLDWKTIQEINNKGFHIERRKENESSFVPVDFITSNAPGGNSSTPLNYVKTDANNFTGNTYYRLKQEDMDGRSTYSVVRMVKGAAGKQLAMQVWPVPSTGPVNVAVNGLTKPDVLMVLDMSGKLVKKLTMQNNTQVQLNGLARGTYLLSFAENRDLVQKIIIQ